MLDCFFAQKPLREEYNIKNLKFLPFHYFDYEKYCIVEKKPTRDNVELKDTLPKSYIQFED